MKINIEPYNEDWPGQFQEIKKELEILLAAFHPEIEHFGSTAVPDLPAKPVIDILVGIEDKNDLPSIVSRLLQHNAYIHYEVFDLEIHDRRLFVRLKDGIDASILGKVQSDYDAVPHELINESRLAHVHIWERDSDDWIRHIAFRDSLIFHKTERVAYGRLKMDLSQKNWSHGMEYNKGKEAFIKEIEAKAIDWHLKRNENS